MTPAEVRAAGAVLWRPAAGRTETAEVEIALVHRPRYDDWSFPKGKLESGESTPFAAVREVAEETGHVARLGPELGEVRYDVAEGVKVVRYWAARSLGGAFVANDETDGLRWVAPPVAASLLSYRHDVDVLARFTSLGPLTSTILLVRHAKAGNHQQWDGDDDLRPLSGTGHEQASHVTEFLALFGPDRIISAPPTRCRDTVAPLAAALGLPVIEEVQLGEEGYWKDPAAGLARLLELAVEPGVTVISSQGGVIPDVVGELVSTLPGFDPDDVAARKASTWVLGFNGTHLRSADYHAYPTG